jgi:hypothetical protein
MKSQSTNLQRSSVKPKRPRLAIITSSAGQSNSFLEYARSHSEQPLEFESWFFHRHDLDPTPDPDIWIKRPPIPRELTRDGLLAQAQSYWNENHWRPWISMIVVRFLIFLFFVPAIIAWIASSIGKLVSESPSFALIVRLKLQNLDL